MRRLSMGKGRLEAFSDGVIAIIITIMVLEIKMPEHHGLKDLREISPIFINYLMSFIYVGIYWNNHHHMFQVVKSINGAILWANLHLLFWMSLIPLATSWLGEKPYFDPWPVAVYGAVLLFTGVAYTILALLLVKHEGEDSTLGIAFGADIKGKASLVLYCVAIGLSCVNPYISFGIYVFVAGMWFIPDKRIEKTIAEESHNSN